MPLHRVIKTYRNGNKVDEIVYSPTTVHSYTPEADVVSSVVQLFKYKVESKPMAPAIVHYTDKTVIGPYGIECHPMTTLNDVDWTPPQVKQDKVVNTSESKSGLGTYKTTYNPNNGTYRCSCFGFIRSRGNCKHVKALKENLTLSK